MNFRDKWLEDYFVRNIIGKNIPGDAKDSLFRRLQMLSVTTCENDLMVPPGNRFERLSGKLKGKCSIRVTKKWRLIFVFDPVAGEASDVYLDPHAYKK